MKQLGVVLPALFHLAGPVWSPPSAPLPNLLQPTLFMPMPKFITDFMNKTFLLKTNQKFASKISGGISCTVSPVGASCVFNQCSTSKPATTYPFCANAKIHHRFHAQCPSVENEPKL